MRLLYLMASWLITVSPAMAEPTNQGADIVKRFKALSAEMQTLPDNQEKASCAILVCSEVVPAIKNIACKLPEAIGKPLFSVIYDEEVCSSFRDCSLLVIPPKSEPYAFKVASNRLGPVIKDITPAEFTAELKSRFPEPAIKVNDQQESINNY